VRYDGIVLDPPAFGRGPGGEVWTFERLFDELCRACRAVLADAPRFVVATVYTRAVTGQALAAAMAGMTAGLAGAVETGALATVERSADRLIHNAVYLRWTSSL
jgi:23S rRNA (cytosine1962-C5)-methyltransferase